ncbi:MAG: ATP-grasp domain-containing protein [Synergistetes bacterium]|nr:ATP-grasp domain-containing protein [Synergistota bacterium]
MEDKALITYGWNRVAYIVNRSLALKGIKTFVGDMSKITMNRFSKFTYKTFCYPNFYVNPKKFIDFIVSYCLKEGIQYVIPIHEESFLVSKYQYLLEKNNIKSLLPNFEKIKIAHKKDSSSMLAKMLGIPIPETVYAKSIDDVLHFFRYYDGNIVIKYLNTNSAKGVFYPRNEDEVKKFEKDIGNFVVQEKVDGIGYGVSLLFNKGELRAKFTHRRIQEKISTGGTSTLRESFENSLLEDYAYQILKYLNWNGVAMVEFKYNEKRRQGWFIEINPRFWGSLALSYIAGVDFPYLVYKILKDGDIEPVLDYRKGVKVKWIAGSIIAFLVGLVRGEFNLYHIFSKADAYDDLWQDDSGKILIGELFYYGTKFLRTLSMNPKENAVLNIDEL